MNCPRCNSSFVYGCCFINDKITDWHCSDCNAIFDNEKTLSPNSKSVVGKT
jgi:transposase-like protein